MNIVKRIITFRPGSTARLITGLVALLAILTVCGITGVADVMRDLAFRDAVYKGRLIEEGAR